MKYQYSTLDLNLSEEKSLKKIKNLLIKNNSNIFNKGIKFRKKIFKGLRPNYSKNYKLNQLEIELSEFSKILAEKIKLKNPILSSYNDMHSLFAVTWHRDDSSFAYPNPRNRDFYNEKKRILKFYIKTKFSFLDLMVKDSTNKESYLKSSNKKISFFDVRNYHQTYIVLPFIKHSFLIRELSKLINKILLLMHHIFKGFDLLISSNFYFVIYEDCQIFRDYEKEEINRSKKQIQLN